MRTRCATGLRYSPKNESQRSKLCLLLAPPMSWALVADGACPTMTMVKTPIEIDEEALRTAAEVLGTKTKKDMVNAALREVGQRLTRLSALARLGEMADQGDFDEFLGNKQAYRR